MIGLALAVALAAAPATAPKAGETVTVFAVGIGNMSCAHWLSTPAKLAEGTAWVMGYWTGSNVWSEGRHDVGIHTDGDAIVGEIKLICTAEPSTQLMFATSRVFSRFRSEGK